MIENDRHMTTRALELMTNALFAQRQDRIQFFVCQGNRTKLHVVRDIAMSTSVHS